MFTGSPRLHVICRSLFPAVLGTALLACSGPAPGSLEERADTSSSSIARAPVCGTCGSVHPTPSYSGTDIFQGVYFGQGDVASLLPDFWSRPEFASLTTLTPDQAAAVGNVISAINTSDPSYFSNFETEMTSGDNNRVSAAFQDGANRIAAVVTAAGGNATAAGASNPQDLVIIATVLIAVNAAVVVNVVFYAIAAVAQIATVSTAIVTDNAVVTTNSIPIGGGGSTGGGTVAAAAGVGAPVAGAGTAAEAPVAVARISQRCAPSPRTSHLLNPHFSSTSM